MTLPEPADQRRPRNAPERAGVRPRSGAARWRLLVFLALGLVGATGLRAQDVELEYKVKAAFLYNFIGFVEWPAGKLAAADKEVLVGCLADDPAAPILARALEGKLTDGKQIRLVVFKELSEITSCHLLFLGRARKAQVDDALDRLKKAPVLTVSEVDHFGERGGMINFVRHERTFRFQVNLAAAERAGLKISSKLASMATVVKTATPPP